MATPQYAMAHDGSCLVMAVNAFTVSGKKNECSIATARLNCVCALALHEIGKLTSPSFSILRSYGGLKEQSYQGRRAENAGYANAAHGASLDSCPQHDKCLMGNASTAFIVTLSMQTRYHARMNLRHLRAFVSIADSGGFARAANRMNLSQPALSRQIRALETELGVSLFDRLGRRVQLTSEGEDLLRRGRRLLTEADSLGERARLLKAGETGILRVGATPQVIENMLANFLTQYRCRHPAVEVHLVEDGGVRLPSRLERGDVHLAFTPASGRFESRLLYPMHVLAALPPTHRLGRRATLEIAELAEEPLLLLRRDFGSREWFDAACSIAHIQPRVLL